MSRNKFLITFAERVVSFMELVAVSFTLKNQSLEDIRTALEGISLELGEDVTLVHGFLTREEVVEKGFGTEVVDLLDKLFPNQINFSGKRQDMVDYVTAMGAEVYVIGSIIDGVKEEYELYQDAGVTVNLVEL
jgi:hypothetical protein